MLQHAFERLVLGGLAIVLLATPNAGAWPWLRRSRRACQCYSQPRSADAAPTPVKELTAADIPPDVTPELKALIGATFSTDYETQVRAIQQLEALGERAAPAVPFLVRLWVKDSPLLSLYSLQALDHIGDASAEPMIAKVKSSSGET